MQQNNLNESPGAGLLSDHELVALFRPQMISYTGKIVPQSDVEDIVQIALEKVILKRHTCKDESKLSYWIFRVLSNTIADFYRQKRESLPGDTFFYNIFESKLLNPEISTITKEQTNCIIDKTESLPDSDSIILFLYYFENIALREISNRLHISMNTAKVRLHRARQKLYSILKNDCNISIGCDGTLSCEKK